MNLSQENEIIMRVGRGLVDGFRSFKLGERATVCLHVFGQVYKNENGLHREGRRKKSVGEGSIFLDSSGVVNKV